MENYKAAAEGDIATLRNIESKRVLNKKCKIRVPGGEDRGEYERLKGKTLLYIACEKGHSGLAQQLIEQGAKAHRRTNFFEKCVDHAAFSYQLRHHRNPFHAAIIHSQNECIKTLLRLESKKLVNSVGYIVKYGYLGRLGGSMWVHKYYPIHLCCFTNNLEAIKLLMDLGAKIEIKEGTNGFSPLLCLFTSRDRLHLLGFRDYRLLFNEGASQTEEPQSETSIKVKKQIIEELISRGANKNAVDNNGRNAVHLAAMDGNIEMLKYALSLGISAHEVDKEGYTPLHNLLDRYDDDDNNWKKMIEVVRILVAAGLDINTKSKKEGKSLLHLCCMKNILVHNFVRELISSLNPDIALLDGNNETALFLALQHHEHEGVIHSLLDHSKCDFKKVEEGSGNNLFHYLALNPHGGVKCVGRLVEMGLDINLQNNNGSTPLHIAAKRGHHEAAQELIAHGADVNKKDKKKGNTPTHLASTSSRSNKVLMVLYSSGADLTIPNDKGKSTLQVMSPKARQYIGV